MTNSRKIEEIVIVPEEASIVRNIFDYYDNKSWGMRKIAVYLNEENKPSPSGGIWGYSTIKYILQNPTYIGLVRWGWRLSSSKKSRHRLNNGHKGILCEGSHKPIINKEQFSRVQKRIKIRRKLGGRAVSSKGLLVGIAKCELCGGGTYVTKYPHWWAYRQPKNARKKYKPTLAYMCSNYSHYGTFGCKRRYIMSKAKLEKIVYREIKKLASNKKAKSTYVQEIKKNGRKKILDEAAQLNIDISKISDKRKRSKKAYESGVISLEEFSKDNKRYSADYSQTKDRIMGKEQEAKDEEIRIDQLNNVIESLYDFENTWEKAEFLDKKELLQSILDTVVVGKSKVSINYNLESKI